MNIQYTIFERTYPETNMNEHRGAKARRKNEQRTMAAWATKEAIRQTITCRSMIITLTRIAPRSMDSDNLPASMKAIRDGIADCARLGFKQIDFFRKKPNGTMQAIHNNQDNPAWCEWKYRQAKGRPGEYCVIVEISTEE